MLCRWAKRDPVLVRAAATGIRPDLALLPSGDRCRCPSDRHGPLLCTGSLSGGAYERSTP